jgi:hypothetical protein
MTLNLLPFLAEGNRNPRSAVERRGKAFRIVVARDYYDFDLLLRRVPFRVQFLQTHNLRTTCVTSWRPHLMHTFSFALNGVHAPHQFAVWRTMMTFPAVTYLPEKRSPAAA